MSLAAFIVIVVGSLARSSCCGHIYIYRERERERVRACRFCCGNSTTNSEKLKKKISNLAACRLFAGCAKEARMKRRRRSSAYAINLYKMLQLHIYNSTILLLVTTRRRVLLVLVLVLVLLNWTLRLSFQRRRIG